ncbi:hypothetical protein SSX86_007554 [Deinandra increscens subsp. villosa]|uniref:RRM domain-containing protein n=1 Tax=Deinandra increscens subsp. villosa TaxID=3103831 RepID=A0AAP0H820_9ASTR
MAKFEANQTGLEDEQLKVLQKMLDEGNVLVRMKADFKWRLKFARKKRNKEITSFFVSDFPDGILVEDFWKLYKSLGPLHDVFIPKKKRYNNENYGFVRFKNVHDIKALEQRMKEIPVGGRRIKVNLSKVPRYSPEATKTRSQTTVGGTKVLKGNATTHLKLGPPNAVWTSSNPLNFKDAVSGVAVGKKKMGQTPEFHRSVNMKRIIIPSEAAEYPKSFMGRSLLGEARDGESLTNIKALRHLGGSSDFDVSYVGGLHVILVFNQMDAANDFLLSKMEFWKSFLESLEVWEGQAFRRRRIIGLKIRGIPLHLRDDSAYNAIGASFGKIVWPSYSSWILEDCSGGEVQVLSDIWKTIDEMVIIEWGGAPYTVMVTESSAPWSPTFEEEEFVTTQAPSSQMSGEGPAMSGMGIAADEVWEEVTERTSARKETVQEPFFDGLGGGTVIENRDVEYEGMDEGSAFSEDIVAGKSFVCGEVNVTKENLEGHQLYHLSQLGCSNQLVPNGPGGPENIIGAANSEPGQVIIEPLLSNSSDENGVNEVTTSLPVYNKKKRKNKKGRAEAILAQGKVMRGGGKAALWGALSRALSQLQTTKTSSSIGTRDGRGSIPKDVEKEVDFTRKVGDLIGVSTEGLDELIAGAVRGEKVINQ